VDTPAHGFKFNIPASSFHFDLNSLFDSNYLSWPPMHPELHRFYHPSLSDAIEQEMEGPEVHHMSKVLRLKEGEELVLLNGHGKLAHVRLESIRKDRCTFLLLESTTGEDQISPLHVAMAPTKQIDRLEWFLEKAVEMGIGSFTPLMSERGERDRLRMDRLERITISAMKQSLRTYFPVLHEATEFSELIKSSQEENKHIAHCYDGEKASLSGVSGSTLILIGPEGDFSLEEVQSALEKGFTAVSLGTSRLRTETAAMKAVALFNQ
jgi:16S rRNA (uracil1498-N3)-methyltransferase